MEKKPRLCVFENEHVAGVVLCERYKQVCTKDPECVVDQSIACDSCNDWYHYSCMGIKGSEQFLQSAASVWKFVSYRKGKGKGKRANQKEK